MDMDISYANEIVKRCFKCDQTVLNNLNIVGNASNLIFWNKFQIFVYESFELESAAKILIPEFQIHDLLFSGNCLVCLDYNGNVHTAFLKFKNTAQKYTSEKSFKYPFQPRAHGIVASSLYDEDHTLCLKYESNSYFLCLHKTCSEFPLVKNVILMYNEYLPLIQTNDKYIIKVLPVTENQLENLKKLFNAEDIHIRNKYSIVVVTFNRLDVYGFLFSSKMTEEHISLLKLYSCPSDLCNLEITESGELSIGLTIGTLIRLSLKDLTTEIVHLNSAIHKFLVINNSTILYTDGISMWKAENATSKDIKFRQFFIKHVKDFIMRGDRIICSTFMNLIYTLSIHDEDSYLKPQSVDEYCSAEKVLNNSEYLKKIMEEVEENETLIKTLGKEKNYITALSLSNRQDIMDSIIKHKLIVYENYEDAIKENTKVLLTNNFAEYFDTESFFFLVQISITSEHKLGDVFNSLGDLRIHITLSTGTKMVKTTTIKVKELIKKISFLIPVNNKMVDTTEMKVNIKMMSNIPGALDTKQKIWAVLYRKNITLHSEHFIKFNLSLNRQECLKNPQESLEELILQAAVNQHGNLFEFDNILRHTPASKEWLMYVRLPSQYQELFRNKDSYTHLNSKKVSYFLQQFTSEDFLKSKSNLIFIIGNEKVKIEIYNDSFSNPLLKISSENIKIVLNIRNFLSDLIYCVFANFGPGKEFINLSSYATVDNIQKAVRKSIAGSSQGDIDALIEQFERNVIGVLPI